jgi:Ca2+-binding EF-hand superfamily protein
MSNSKRCCLALLIGLSLVGAALAQVAKKQGAVSLELFQELDSNRDNIIDRSEVPESVRASFDQLLKRGDDNHNGKLEAEEYRALLVALRTFTEQAKNQAVTRFKSMDKDGDGKVSRDEFTGPKPRFDVLDRDGDGLVTEQEFLSGAQVKAAGKVPAKKKAALDKKADDVKKAE